MGVTTSDEVLGIRVPMATAIADRRAARREYLDEPAAVMCMCWPTVTVHTVRRAGQGYCLRGRRVVLGTPLAEAAEALGHGCSGRPRQRTRRCLVGHCCRSPSANARRWSGFSTGRRRSVRAPST